MEFFQTLFALERRDRAPHLDELLGRAHYVRHENERPMRIIERLEGAMPSGWYTEAKIAAG